MEPNEIDNFIARLRAESQALKGDGFGRVGNLKSAYKKAARRLDELLGVLNAPVPEASEVTSSEDDCYGEYGYGVPGCKCRRNDRQSLGE